MSAGKRQPRMDDAGPGFRAIDAIARMSRLAFDMRAAARLPVRHGRCVDSVTRQGSRTAKVAFHQHEFPGAAGRWIGPFVSCSRSDAFMPVNRQAACRPDRSRVSIHDGAEVAVCVLHVRERSTVRFGCLVRCVRGTRHDSWEQQVRSISCRPFMPCAPEAHGHGKFSRRRWVTCTATRGQAPETRDSPCRRGLRTLPALPSVEK